MVKKIISGKKKYFIFILIIVGIVTSFFVIQFIKSRKADNGITYAQMAKMLMFVEISDDNILSDNNSNSDNESGYWYQKYIDYINEKGWIKITKPNDAVTYKDLKKVVAVFIDDADLLSDLDKKNGNVKKEEFINIYFKIVERLGKKDIKEMQIGIAATPSNSEKAGEWEAYTTKGKLRFTGLILDKYKDKTIDVIVKENEILMVKEVVSDNVTYENVWIKSADESGIDASVYGADRIFKIKGISDNLSNVLADIVLESGKIKQINTKTDTITGKVLSVTNQYVEIEGYGKVPIDEFFVIYDLNNDFTVKSYNDIVVGYSLQDFIVADGKICGAAIMKKIDVSNIRVIIKTTGYKSIFHDYVELTSDKNYTVSFGEQVQQFAAGERIKIEKNDSRFSSGRISIVPDQEGSVLLLNINRSQGNPWYEGKMEISQFDDGIVIVNDIGIEQYLKRVVPSEMPSSFGVEALKVQAVCARSYAYKQLTNNYYSMYGAHVDDSTMYQVYNNTLETENANKAISETNGQVIKYNNEVVQTYYYSTSCGVNTDVGIWGTNTDSYPYFKSVYLNPAQKNLNLQDEYEFEKFIQSQDENDFDYGFVWYRWEISMPCDVLSAAFNAKLHEKYIMNPQKILTKDEKGEYSSQNISTVGDITQITVNERAAGGAIKSITVTGTANSVKINSESLIRSLLCTDKCEMKNVSSVTKTDTLPSTFCIIRPVCEGEKVTAFKVTGGGYGHGIGMSQNAVSKMVEKAYSYTDIISFFYPQTQIETAD